MADSIVMHESYEGHTKMSELFLVGSHIVEEVESIGKKLDTIANDDPRIRALVESPEGRLLFTHLMRKWYDLHHRMPPLTT